MNYVKEGWVKSKSVLDNIDSLYSIEECKSILLELNNKMQIKRNTRFEVLTPNGYQDFAGIRKLCKDKIYAITLSSNITLKCSETHKFISNGLELEANKLRIGSTIDSIDNNIATVIDINIETQPIELYDIIEVNRGNIFIVDGIVSHNCDFITSGHSVIEGPLLKWYETTYIKDPIEKRGIGSELWIWEAADYTKDYVVVADVARGDGADYSAFHVIDVESVTQVAEFKGQISTKEYGNLLVNIATEYNDALLVIENANVGWASIQVAIDRGYKNLYYSPKDSSVSDVSQQLARYVDLKDTSQMTPGFTTSSRTRPLVISKLDTYMRERVPVIQSRRLLEELQVFIWNGSRPEAQHGYNDDLVMSFSIGLWIRDTALKLRQQGMDLSRKALDHFSKGAGVYNSRPGQLKDAGWTMPVGKTGKMGHDDITWLL